MVKDLKEELDVDKATRVSPAGTARPKVEEAKEQIVEEVNEGDFVTCLGFPCMDTTCLKHYTVEGVCGSRQVLGNQQDPRQLPGQVLNSRRQH